MAEKNSKQYALKICRLLGKEYPEALCELDYTTAFQLLIATILSAQCTDKKVNIVTPSLFKKYPTAQKMATAKQPDVEKLIKSLGLFRNKAKSIIACANGIENDYGGEIPNTIDALTKLAGVGRKTANCVLVNAFDLPGIMADTHCIRLSNRLGLLPESTTDAVKVEKYLKELLPKKEWSKFSHRIILHGRRVCYARKPNCPGCTLKKICPYADKTTE